MSDLQTVLQNMLNKTFYVALRKPRDLTHISEVLPRHIEWILEAERTGDVFLSGPFTGDGAPGPQGGMSILRAPSLDVARKLIAEDPFIAEGVFEAEVRPWLLMEGNINCMITLSNQRVSID
jgi:uncharacterized protein